MLILKVICQPIQNKWFTRALGLLDHLLFTLFESGASLLQFDSRLCPSVDQIVTRVAQSGLHPLGSALLAFARVVQEQAVNLWRLTSSGPSYWFCSAVCGLIGGRAAVAAAGWSAWYSTAEFGNSAYSKYGSRHWLHFLKALSALFAPVGQQGCFWGQPCLVRRGLVAMAGWGTTQWHPFSGTKVVRLRGCVHWEIELLINQSVLLALLIGCPGWPSKLCFAVPPWGDWLAAKWTAYFDQPPRFSPRCCSDALSCMQNCLLVPTLFEALIG